MPSSNQMARAHLRKLSRQGRLLDECFKVFQRQVFPGAPPDQVFAMRTCFFAGAAELWAVMHAAMDEGDDVSTDEEAFMQGWVSELERFHARTVAASKAGGPRQ